MQNEVKLHKEKFLSFLKSRGEIEQFYFILE